MSNDFILDGIRALLSIFQLNPRKDIRTYTQFLQVWSSTALGFEGCGGDMMTPASTTVVFFTDGSAEVWFAHKLAYRIKHPSEKFMADVAKQQMRAVDAINGYEKNE